MSFNFTNLSILEPCQPRNKAPHPNKDEEVNNLRLQYLEKQRSIARKLFDDLSSGANSALIEEIDGFINRSLQNSEHVLFTDCYSKIIHPVRVILGTDASDNKLTLDMIHNHVSEENRNLKIIRVVCDKSKKNHLESILEEASESKKLLVIVEQVEDMELSFLEQLVGSLSDILQKTEGSHIIIMFCLTSGVSKDLTELMTLGAHDFDIVKEAPLNLKDRLSKLNVNRFKLGPKMIDFVYDNFSQRGGSIAQLEYLYEYAMHEYHIDPVSLLTIDRKYLTNVVKPDSNLVESIRDLGSIRTIKGTKVNWSSATSIIQFCVKSIVDVLKYHDFLISQIECYLPLIKGDTRGEFPEHINEIFEQLWEFDSLHHSPKFMDAIDKVRKYPNDKILKRIEASIASCQSVSDRKGISVASILSNYKGKLENNEDCKKVKEELRARLFEHAKLLRSPRTFPLHEAVYFNDSDAFSRQTEPCIKNYARYCADKRRTHYEILLSLVHQSQEVISKADLFDDFKDASSSQINDDGLLKAIFIDLIGSMEDQGLIKTDKRKSANGMIKRVVWF